LNETLKVSIIPIRDIPKSIMKSISDGIKEVYSPVVREVKVASKFELPSEAYNPNRDQYRAEIILQRLSSRYSSKEGKILAITTEDLYSEGLNFIFGQAQKPGKFALISLHRLRPEFWEDEKDRRRFLTRAVKEAIHELGHTFGLEHCESLSCVMTFSNRIGHTDRKDAKFCEKCKKKIKRLYQEG